MLRAFYSMFSIRSFNENHAFPDWNSFLVNSFLNSIFSYCFFEIIETICFLCYSDSVYGIVFFMLARLKDNNDYRLEERIT